MATLGGEIAAWVGFARRAATGADEDLLPRTWILPALSTCLTVFEPFQLLENHSAPLLFNTVTPSKSALPGSPASVTDTWRLAFASTRLGASGNVMSTMFPLALNDAVPPEEVVLTESELMALPLTWYTWPPLRTSVVTLPRGLESSLSYFTPKPKSFRAPTGLEAIPAEFGTSKKPPPVTSLPSGFATVTRVMASELLWE